MPDRAPTPDGAARPDLALDALLYANGELEGAEAAAFEERLGADQAVREALCQAVHLWQTVGRQPPAGPDPAYRARVRARLRRQPRWEWLFSRQTYRGHPALWSAFGAAAAVLLVIGLAHLPPNLVARTHPPLPLPAEAEKAAPPAEPAQLAASAEVPALWTTVPSAERVSKARAEELRRRQRAEELPRSTKPAEGRLRSIHDKPPRY